MSYTADLLDWALAIYEREGQSGVERWADRPEIAPNVEMLFCTACEAGEPHIDEICAVCWTVHRRNRGRLGLQPDVREFLRADEYGEEAILRLENGYTRRTNAGQVGEPSFGGDYVRVVDTKNREVAYWHSDEWRDDPLVVMGAIFGAACGISASRTGRNA